MKRPIISCQKKREEIVKKFCEHISTGKSQSSFVYDDGEITLSRQLVEKWIKETPYLYDYFLNVAKAKQFGHWEKVLHECARGENKIANVSCLRMIFRNMFNWEKEENPQDKQDAHLDELRSFFSSIIEKKG